VNAITVRSGGTVAVLYPGTDTALVTEDGQQRRIEVTRWLMRENGPDIPVLSLNGHSEAEVASAVVRALA